MIALDDRDRARFVHSLHEFNDVSNVNPNHRIRKKPSDTKRNTLVSIHAWCLMPNHYHVLLSENVDNGISLFLKKLNMGYAKYFNERYARSGALWQGKTKKIEIKRDAHFMYVPYYIHLNPLDMSMPQWRRGAVKDTDLAIEKLRAYRWSSHRDYLGEENFRSVVVMSTLETTFGSYKMYEKSIRGLIQDPIAAADSLVLE
ncbi:MAG: transposase [Minisyncoccia bacterium]